MSAIPGGDRLFRKQQEVSDLFVVGSIGPTLEGNESPSEATEVYREQLRALEV